MTTFARRDFLGLAAGGAVGLACAPALAGPDVYSDSGFKLLKMGAIRPGGWIREQLVRDLKQGATGHYDKINPTVSHDLFGANKRESSPLGIPIITANQRPAWWSGEHEGYWKDAVTRTAFLTKDEEYMERAHGWMERILDNQGSDGYIGIYKKGNRYNHAGENGELWAQSRIMVAMLAYAEFTGDQSVYGSVKKAVDLTMSEYVPGQSYFRNSNSKLLNGGLSHGLAFADVLEWLYRDTGSADYKSFTEFLYKDFSKHCKCNNDIALQKLLERDRKFYLHAPHIAEHFMIPFFLAQTTGKDEYREASQNAMHKLRYHLTPSKGLVGHENVDGDRGTADALYEYCSITELAISLVRTMQFTGSAEAADMVETMTMNAGQGARLPVLKACSYLTSDNRETINRHGHLGREGYSASHFAAACCTLNAGRLMPHYISGMWMQSKKPQGLAAMLYGPCELDTQISGVKVHIKEETDYPFSDNITFTISPDSPLDFSLLLRKPGFVKDMKIKGPDCTIKPNGNFMEVRKKWNKGDQFTVTMEPEVETVPGLPGGWTDPKEYCVRRGPLLFSLKIPARLEKVSEHRDSGFYDYEISPQKALDTDYRLIEKAGFETKRKPSANPLRPFEESPLVLGGEMHDKSGRAKKVELVPQGCTILRRVSFPKE